MKLKRYILLVIAGISLTLSACNDDFMQRDPMTDVAEGSFLSDEGDLKYYLNSLYRRYVRGFETGYCDQRYTHPFSNMQGPRLTTLDRMTDNLANYGNADSRLTGRFTTPNASTDYSKTLEEQNPNAGWDWRDVRTINYFLENYTNALPSVGGDIGKLKKWAAEAYFFKAWEYYHKVTFFGDVPWIEVALNVNSPELYMERTPRAEVMDSVMWCINYAVENLEQPNRPVPDGRISTDMANFLKARIGLYEGSYRTYHTELGLQSSAKKFLDECVTACEAIISSGRYSLYNEGVDPYWKMFTFIEIPGAVKNPEAILARTYNGVELGHAMQRYYEMNRARGHSIGATKSFVDEALCEDGRPIYIGGSGGNWELNPLFEGFDGLWSELENRDPRLRQQIARPGEYATIYTSGNGVWGDELIYPPIGYNYNPSSGQGTTVTGYWVIKHWMGNLEQFSATTKGKQTAVEFRYGEVLLMLAEAKAILGTITDNDLDRTINALRQRAGYDFTKYPDARLTTSNIPADPRLDAVYAEKLEYPVSPLIREIRRERRVEMFQEARRYEDLMRWKAGNLMTVPMRGMKFLDEKQELYDGSNDGKQKPPAQRVTAQKAIVNADVYIDDEGFLIVYPRTTGIVSGTLPWGDYRYYWPIPLQDLRENGQLKQNPGWEDIPR